MRCILLIFIVLIEVLGTASPAHANDMEKVMQVWCTQSGARPWMIDITAKDGTSKSQELVTSHERTEVAKFHIVRERFCSGASTVKVTFIDASTQYCHTSYFVNGKVAQYSFSFVSIEATDDTHWKTIIASTPGSETYEGRQTILRYIRVRNGDTIESWKDVQFADGKTDFEPRSNLVRKLQR